jgi:CSLREA domain-containing protein
MKALLYLLILPTLLLSQTFVVNTTDDSSDGSCLDGSCSLRDAIYSADNSDTISVEINGTITLASSLTINHDITITATGPENLAISGNGTITPFKHFINPLTLSNMSIVDGNGSSGGAIYSNAPGLTLKNIHFKNNRAKYRGGAIYSKNTPLNIQSCQFKNNSSGNVGGAIDVNSSFEISDTLFKDNNSTDAGGAIYLKGISSISTSTFIANFSHNGGAILYEYGNINSHTLQDSTFMGNYATQDGGGALFVKSSLAIERTLFELNLATTARGGAIFIRGSSAHPLVSDINITNSTFHSNTALRGGAIASSLTDIALNISHSTITQNVNYDNTFKSGGILHMLGELNIKNSVISHNYTNSTLADCDSADSTNFHSYRANNVAVKGSCPFDETYDFISLINQLEEPLSDNGGRSKTCKPTENSQLINSASCFDNAGRTVRVDQRGYLRDDGQCDIGAYERNPKQAFLPSIYYLLN